MPDHNRRFAKAAPKPTDAHRQLGAGHRLESILSIQVERVVSNDYVVRWANRHYQLLPPVYPGERGGRVVIETRRDGSMAMRFGTRYLAYQQIGATPSSGSGVGEGGLRPSEGSKKKPSKKKPSKKKRPSKVWRPPADHPWRKRVVC